MSAELHVAPLERVRAFHRGEIEATEEELDAALGLPRRQPSSDIHEDAELVRRHPNESFADLPTPFAVTRGLFEALDLTDADFFFDLGCGTGRVVLYGAAVSPGRFCGIEIVEDRVEIAQGAVRATGLERLAILGGSVMEHDLTPASIIYMSRPFGEETEPKVLARLHEQGRVRPLTIVTHRLPPGRIAAEVFEPLATGTLSIYRSRR